MTDAKPISLGDRLRANILATQQETAAGDLARARANNLELMKEQQLVMAFFDRAKAAIETAIEGGKTSIELEIGKRDRGSAPATDVDVHKALMKPNWTGQLQKMIDDRSHPHHGSWTEFREWATGEGLEVLFQDRHDGMGHESWHALTAKPKDLVANQLARAAR